jgi:hypothetical protein
MKIDEELILRVINGINPYLIAIGILSVLFELSMIVSFELKYLKGDALMITTLIAYIVVVIANPFLALIKNNFVACISLILDVLSFSALFYLLEDKTTEVVCLQYVNENGEKIQIAITLTCPKNPVEANTTSRISGKINFEEDPVVAPATFVPAEITQAEKDNIATLMQRLGL